MSEVPEYQKIDTLFERGEGFKVNAARIRRPEFGVPGRWLVTEKVDGTNVRVSLETEHQYEDGVGVDRWVVRFYGRTAAAEIPHAPGPELLEYLQRTFTLEKMKALWRGPGEAEYPIILYGEGYGAKIQKGGGNYRRDGDVSLRLFDVLIGGTWLRRRDVEDVARQLGIDAVPLLAPDKLFPLFEGQTDWPLHKIVDLVRCGFDSLVALVEGTAVNAEGVVAFTDPPLYNGRGQRLMFKLKTKDF